LWNNRYRSYCIVLLVAFESTEKVVVSFDRVVAVEIGAFGVGSIVTESLLW